MGKKHLVPIAFFAVCFGVLWLTGDRTERADRSHFLPQPDDPTAYPEVDELRSHGVRIGSASGGDLRVARAGDKVRIEIAPSFLERLPKDFLSGLGWTRPVNLLSEEGYGEFLETLDRCFHSEEGHEKKASR